MLLSLEKPEQERCERAYVMITCEDGFVQEVTECLKTLGGVKEVARTIGSYDIIVKADVSSITDLRELIAIGVRTIPKVRSTTIVCKPNFFI